MRTYQSWARQRNQHSQNQCPVDLFNETYPPDVICTVLQKFVTKARREDGSPYPYPLKTLYQLLCGLLRHSHDVQEDSPNFLDLRDVRFKKLHGTCDCIFRGLHKNGVGTAKKSAKIISEEMKSTVRDTRITKCRILLRCESVLLDRWRRAEKFNFLLQTSAWPWSLCLHRTWIEE